MGLRGTPNRAKDKKDDAWEKWKKKHIAKGPDRQYGDGGDDHSFAEEANAGKKKRGSLGW